MSEKRDMSYEFLGSSEKIVGGFGPVFLPRAAWRIDGNHYAAGKFRKRQNTLEKPPVLKTRRPFRHEAERAAGTEARFQDSFRLPLNFDWSESAPKVDLLHPK